MNTTLFAGTPGRMVPAAPAVNEAGGAAYSMTPEHALAQLAVTGTLSDTFYASAETQLDSLLAAAAKCDAEYVARCAVYARRKGHMKDTPAVLLAVLAGRKTDDARAWLRRAFPRVVDNGKMLRNFVQAVRSGALGRKSMGHCPRRLVADWLLNRPEDRLFRDDVGEKPSLGDCIKLSRPRPAKESAREALFGRFIGKDLPVERMPEIVQTYEAWRRDRGPIPEVLLTLDFRMFTALPLTTEQWQDIARKAPWHMTRMNLNTFARHGVFADKAIVETVAARLRNPDQVRESRVFPYQLLVSYMATTEGHDVPVPVTEALQDAMEIAVENVPMFGENVVVCPDVSGSMRNAAVTGHRARQTSVARAIHVAGLVTAAVLRRNPTARVIPFSDRAAEARINPRDSVMTIAQGLARCGGGGTCVSAPLALLNAGLATIGTCIIVSDDQSWAETQDARRGTETMRQWESLKARCPAARLVCIDVQPSTTMQATGRPDILHVGGWGDAVFDVIADFARSELGPAAWSRKIKAVDL